MRPWSFVRLPAASTRPRSPASARVATAEPGARPTPATSERGARPTPTGWPSTETATTARLAVGASDDDSPSMRRDRLSRDGRAWDKPMHEAPVQVQLVAPPVLARELPRSVAGAPGRSTEAGAELPTLRAAGHPGRPRGPAVGGRDPRSGEPRVNLRALPQEEIFIRGRPRSSPAYTWTEGVLTGDCRRVWNASSGGARGAPGRGDR